MYCIYSKDGQTFEFDARTPTEEKKKLQNICTQQDWKIEDMKKEE